MAKHLMPWKELLSFEEFDEYSDEFGPNTQAVVNCFETLDTISWFSSVGAEEVEADAERVNTWGAALEPILAKREEKYGDDGHLRAPAELIEDAMKLDAYQGWFEDALEAVDEYVDFQNYIPSYFEKPEVAFMTEHLRHYIRNLVVEIVAADAVDCTYFREILSWYEAGHFPCGWEGDWPDGHPRVF